MTRRFDCCGNCLRELGTDWVEVYTPFEEPIPVPPILEGLCDPIEGIRSTVHTKCLRADQQPVLP